MNWNIFSPIGYAGVVLLLVLPLLWIVHWRRRPRRWLCHVGVIVALAAFVLVKINSATYVRRIEEDRSEQIARAAAAIEKDRKRREAEREEDVAGLRFAEDGRGDFLDKGGMNEGELAYYEGKGAEKKNEADKEPAWKRKKVERQSAVDTSLDGDIGATEETEGADTSRVEKDLRKPIVLPKKAVELARRLNRICIRLSRWAIWFGLGLVVVDYLQRFRRYDDAYFPLPVPDAWVRSMSPAPAVSARPATPRREMLAELEMLVRQGATFLCMTDDEALADSLPEVLYRLPRKLGALEVLPVAVDGDPLSADFVFETLWFGRAAFVETERSRIDVILARFSELLSERKASRARVTQPVVLVWHRQEPVPDIFEENMRILGPVTGVSLFIC